MTRLFASVVAIFVSVAATGPKTSRIPSEEEIVHILQDKLTDIPADFECGWRQLAYKYAQQLQPFRSASEFAEIFDALNLGACGAEFYLPVSVNNKPSYAGALTVATTGTSLYIDPVNGNDSNPGTIGSPFQHLPYAVSQARSLPVGTTTIFLRQGVYRLTDTLQLGAQDNGLTITAYGAEVPVISSGVILPITRWQPYNASSLIRRGDAPMVVVNNSNNIYNQIPSNPGIVEMGLFPSSALCEAACLARSNCTSFTWHGLTFPSPWNGSCWERSDSVWAPKAQEGVVSGHLPEMLNVWVADIGAPGTAANPLPAWLNTPSRPDFVMSLLYSPDGGMSTQRATRARYPNANPETDLFPAGWLSGGSYVQTPIDTATEVVEVPNPNPGDPPGMFASEYVWGYGGPCERLTDAAHANGSYWCQPYGRVNGGQYFFHTPIGLTVDSVVLPTSDRYAADPNAAIDGGAIVNYWHKGHWFTQIARLGSVTAARGESDNVTLHFGLGNFHGCEGMAVGETWYIENSPFELDFANEFWYDASAGKLYYFHNASDSSPPPATWTFEVPLLQTLINISGTSSNPASGITLSGLTFTSAAPTYLAPHGLPSGGDWGLARFGAVFLEGTQSVTVLECVFTRVDGNGVFVAGWNRNATVDKCSFKWMGESAVATWGNDHGLDATAYDFPMHTTMSNNICRLIGSTEKQVSCFFQSVSAFSTISGNIMFSMPRAAVNFNDFVAGGSEMVNNLIWDTCLESQDHGPFNSWDRVPYHINEARTPNSMHHNFMIAGGGANSGAFDNDDGSSFYEIFSNVEIYGGHKSNFDGHSKRHYNNLNLFSLVYGSKCVEVENIPPIPGFAEGYYNNTCVLTSDAMYMHLGDCDSLNASHFAEGMMVGNNRVFVDGYGGNVTCGATYTFAQWEATGLDPGTTLSTTLPDTSTMMQWAAVLLGIQN